MDDLIALTGPILEKMELLKALNSQFRSSDIVARQKRRERLKEQIQEQIKTARADTLGNVDPQPIEELVLEKYSLDKTINEDRATFARRFHMLGLVHECTVATQKFHSIIAPERQATQNPLPADSIPTPSRSSVVHESLERAEPEREPTVDSPPPLVDDAEPIPTGKRRSFTPRRKSSNLSLNENRPVKRSRRGEITPSLTPARSIEFNAVYQDGEAPVKYRIVQFPFHDGHWYILECKDCGIQFQSVEAVEEAQKHVHANHGRKFDITLEQIVVKLGTHVSGCNAELADKNNACFELSSARAGDTTEAESEDEQHPKTVKPTNEQRKKHKRGRTKGSTNIWKIPTTFKDIDPRVINAKPGDILSWYNSKSQCFVPIMIVPWGPFPRFYFERTLEKIELNTSIPQCYDGAQSTDIAPRPWAPGYEDNGELAHKRSLPGLFFRKEEDFPHDCTSGWVQLNKLKVYDKNCPRTRHKDAVEEYTDYCRKNPPGCAPPLKDNRGPENNSRDNRPSPELGTSEVQSTRHSTQQNNVASTIEEPKIKEDQDKEENEDREEDREERNVSGFRKHYRMGVRRAHIVRSVEVDDH
ncbi:hypothetical protein IL306_004520 [Fusarium sp. DS 682]|nr:hypothetical protein IL306_004520 [Fusarium sp. DS 682]